MMEEKECREGGGDKKKQREREKALEVGEKGGAEGESARKKATSQSIRKIYVTGTYQTRFIRRR